MPLPHSSRHPPPVAATLTTSQRGGKSSVSIALICTTRRWIPACASTNQGPEKGDLIPRSSRNPSPVAATLPSSHRGSKSSVSIALICTTRRWIPAYASANQGLEKGDLVVPRSSRSPCPVAATLSTHTPGSQTPGTSSALACAPAGFRV